MTEAEWLAATDPTPMLKFLWGKASERKLRLFVSGCCRRIWHLLPVQPGQAAVVAAEHFADAKASDLEHDEIRRRVAQAIQNAPEPAQSSIRSNAARSPLQAAAYAVTSSLPARETVNAARWAAAAVGWAALDGMPGAVARRASRWNARRASAEVEEQNAQACLMRDIFGNPFRLVVLDPAWRTSTALALAQQMYDSRDFSPMPILADALQDAGCGDEGILSHCRGEGPHARGCWVVDLVRSVD